MMKLQINGVLRWIVDDCSDSWDFPGITWPLAGISFPSLPLVYPVTLRRQRLHHLEAKEIPNNKTPSGLQKRQNTFA